VADPQPGMVSPSTIRAAKPPQNSRSLMRNAPELLLNIDKNNETKHYKNTEEIMVILIGGAGCVGKTLMAQKLLEIYQMPYLSIDHLKTGIFRSCPDCGFTPESQDEIIAEKLWPIIKAKKKK
jgi:hypothetical protein